MTRWESSRKSWNVTPITKNDGSVNTNYKRSWSEKLKLLLWKNYKIQTRHKLQTIIELLLPLVFVIILVIIRIIVKSQFITEPTIYEAYALENNPPYDVLFKCDKLFYTPSNNATDTLMMKVKQDFFYDQGFEYNFTGFATEEELVAAYLSSSQSFEGLTSSDLDATSPVLAGVVFESNFTDGKFSSEIQYKLRFPTGLRSEFDIIEEKFGLKANWFTEIAFPLFQLLGPRARNKTKGGLPGYYDEGFLYLQYAVDRTLIRTILNSAPDELQQIEDHNLKLQRFPYPAYTNDKYLFALQAFLPILMLLSFIYPVINISKSIVYEKEMRLKESMKMMGLSNWLHWTAWFIKSYLSLVISCLLMTILLKVRVTESQSLPVIPYTDGTLLYFIFLVFSFSTICFCFFISSLFSRANTAATGAGAVWFLFYLPYAFLQPRYNLLPNYVKILCCALTNTPISFACQIICMFEGTGAGLQWSSINHGSSPDDDFSLAYALIMMVFNAFIYLFAALYFEAVWPGEYGIPLPYNFFLKKWYWTGGPRHDIEIDFEGSSSKQTANLNIEASPRNLTPGIQIQNLTKKFGSKLAVNKLNLDMYEGHITALLGHNGAGKTTTISMLTGLFPPTSGTALLNGHDIHREMDAIRSSLGICPQHNVLFDELTVEEHLRFFCLLKGMEKHLVDPEINRLLSTLGLESKRHAKSRTLSGGMKRKLSILIAFCADSKIVLLDECTTGMDLGSRRCAWDLIQSEKQGRTIILSTHFMEEADVLGDRIAIMADGELQCCGSSLFLKKRYGGGYHLIMVKKPDCVINNITNVIKKHISEAEVDQNVGAELSYCLPDSKSGLFAALFEELEAGKDDLGIDSYGASITTMEEVFMKVLKDAESKKSGAHADGLDLVRNTSTVELGNNNEDAKSGSDFLLFRKNAIIRNTGLTLLFQQFWAMVVKKLLYALRNKFLLIVQMLLPVCYVIITFLCLNAFPGFSNPDALKMGLERYESVGKTVTSLKCFNDSVLCKSYNEYLSQNFNVHLIEEETTFTDYILKLAEKQLTAVNFQYIIGYEERLSEKNTSEIIGYFNNQPFHGPPLALNLITNAILRRTNHTVMLSNHPLPESTLDSFKDAGGLLTVGFQIGYNISIAITFLTATFIVFVVRERETGSKLLQYISGVRFLLFWLASFIVDFINFMIPIFGILGILVLFQMAEFLTLPMQKNFLVLMGSFGFAVIPFTYLLSYLSTNPTTGFSRTIILSMFIGLAPMMTMIFVGLREFQLENLVEELNKYFLISPNYAMGMGLVQLSINYQFNQLCPNFNLEHLCEAFPDSLCCNSLKADYLDWERFGIGRNIFYLLVSGCVYFSLIFLIEFKIFSRIINLFKKTRSTAEDNSDTEENIGLEDSDVHMEDDKIRRTDLNTLFKSENVVVRDLTKMYSNFAAVDKINFGVAPGECFGLLGTNGAGKTTTFKQLTGDVSVTSGDAFVCGKSVRKQIREVHANIGYTPQFDGLIDEMTGRETIRMFARLRGIPEKYIDEIADELGNMLLFTKHLEKQVCELSGGNKRKLSTACAMVGKPSVVLLDEPSSGMDPVARRHLWNAVSTIRDAGTSIVLTTHSLEEAESLCTRLAIMVNGKFRCLGSPQQLKNKFSKGYTLIAQVPAKMSEENEIFTRSMEEQGRRRSSMRQKRSPVNWESGLDDLRNFIEEAFPGCILKDIHPGFVHYHVMPSETTSWGKMFSIMEEAKEKFSLEAYSVGQTSLEQVFLNFTKAQINSE